MAAFSCKVVSVKLPQILIRMIYDLNKVCLSEKRSLCRTINEQKSVNRKLLSVRENADFELTAVLVIEILLKTYKEKLGYFHHISLFQVFRSDCRERGNDDARVEKESAREEVGVLSRLAPLHFFFFVASTLCFAPYTLDASRSCF